MARTPPNAMEYEYSAAARFYFESLGPEDFSETTDQARQCKITLQSFDLLSARRPEIRVFNKLLVQYPKSDQDEPGQVVPDNLVVVSDEPLEAAESYDLPFQPVGPFWVLEYPAKRARRKAYKEDFKRYEKELEVPYFLLFYPDTQDLTLYRHTGTKYAAVPPNEQGRCPLPELELELGLLDGWVRYWFRGELLPLPADLQRQLDELRVRLEQAEHRAEEAVSRAEAAERELELLRAQLRQAQGPKPS